jgi:hypothetical protein
MSVEEGRSDTIRFDSIRFDSIRFDAGSIACHVMGDEQCVPYAGC